MHALTQRSWCSSSRSSRHSALSWSSQLRKLRWLEPKRGKGKRGGVRIIDYWYEPRGVIYLLLAYSKGQRDDLAAREKRLLKQLVSEEFK